jgi:hypothetical protein
MKLPNPRVGPLEASDCADLLTAAARVDDKKLRASIECIEQLRTYVNFHRGCSHCGPTREQIDHLPARLIIAVWAAEPRNDNVPVVEFR